MTSLSPDPSPTLLPAIGQIAIRVHDAARAEAFYRDALGLRHLFSVPGRLAFFDCGGIRLMLSVPEGQGVDHPPSILYYKVPDIRAAHETLKSRGVRFEDEPRLVAPMPDHDLWMTFFRDSEENLLALMSEVPR